MTPWQNRVTDLTRRMAEDMKLRNYSQRTIDTYTYHLGRFAQFVGRSPLEATAEDVRSFQLHMIEVRKYGWSSFNQAVCGLRFFFRTTSPRSWHVDMIPFGKRPKKLPAVLSGEEVNRLLSCVKCHKHRKGGSPLTRFRYRSKLRIRSRCSLLHVAFVCLLKTENRKLKTLAPDIDSQRMQLRVGSGKGQKTRIVPMSPRLLTELREYWKVYRPPLYLFCGKTSDVPLSATTIQKMFKVAAKDAGILKDVTPHTLRHSYATGLLEAGVDLLTISRLLGHASFSTTMIYLHVRTLHLGSAPSPIDWLPIRQLPGWMQPPTPPSPPAPPTPN